LRLRSGNTDCTPVVLELSSWQLEYLPEARRAPDVAVITNLYPDHMNRYTSLQEYARAKANIFKNQTRGQALIVNSRAESVFRVLYPSKVLFDIIRFNANCTSYDLVRSLGEHNASNFAVALLASRRVIKKYAGREFSEGEIQKLLPSLSRVLPRFRQQIIYQKNGICIINDSASTSPEAAIAALQRFSGLALERKCPLFFIAGGTDKNLSYRKLGTALRVAFDLFKSHHLSFSLLLLEGGATRKIQALLSENLNIEIYKDLSAIVESAKKLARGGGIIVFSPGAASFEKFKNEFDRGEKFDVLVRKCFMV
ncbi:MAG: Mur ligase family protein, partial [Nanoarchaeota archaeon]|nr:Mur ligase family protein [Nanoarchaeota archaeon]